MHSGKISWTRIKVMGILLVGVGAIVLAISPAFGGARAPLFTVLDVNADGKPTDLWLKRGVTASRTADGTILLNDGSGNKQAVRCAGWCKWEDTGGVEHYGTCTDSYGGRSVTCACDDSRVCEDNCAFE